MMVCSGVLVGCDMVLTAAHCLKYRDAPDNRFWFYLQHGGMLEVKSDKIEIFCDSQPCRSLPESAYDLGIARLASPVWHSTLVDPEDRLSDTTETSTNFVGFGIKPPRLDNYNLKQLAPIRLSECEDPFSNDHSLCSNLSDDLLTPCHKDSGGPLYTVSDEGRQSLLGIAIRTGLGCRAGQAVYTDTTNPEINSWLEERIAESKERCRESSKTPTEIFSEPEGWLSDENHHQELDIEVEHGFDALLVTMNHAPGETSGEMNNDFSLELSGPSASDDNSTISIQKCENNWKLVSQCRVENPAQGSWKARVTRTHGEGHFQLVASGISR